MTNPTRRALIGGVAASSLASRYPEWTRFQAVRRQLDPDGRFRSAFADRVLGAP